MVAVIWEEWQREGCLDHLASKSPRERMVKALRGRESPKSWLDVPSDVRCAVVVCARNGVKEIWLGRETMMRGICDRLWFAVEVAALNGHQRSKFTVGPSHDVPVEPVTSPCTICQDSHCVLKFGRCHSSTTFPRLVWVILGVMFHDLTAMSHSMATIVVMNRSRYARSV